MIDFVTCHIDWASDILGEQDKSLKLQGEALFTKVTEVNQDMMRWCHKPSLVLPQWQLVIFKSSYELANHLFAILFHT